MKKIFIIFIVFFFSFLFYSVVGVEKKFKYNLHEKFTKEMGY